jgi:hypothetical protein
MGFALKRPDDAVGHIPEENTTECNEQSNHNSRGSRAHGIIWPLQSETFFNLFSLILSLYYIFYTSPLYSPTYTYLA